MNLTLNSHTILIDTADWSKMHTVAMSAKGLYFIGRPCDVTWRVAEKNHTNYVVASVGGKFELRLHRLVMGASRGQQIDHINGNGLDNRRENLRYATAVQNARNRRANRSAKSNYVGVSYSEKQGKWHARIRLNGKLKHLGSFDTEYEAAEARDAAVKKYRPEFGLLNLATT